MKNRDIVFNLKVNNETRAGIGALGSDLNRLAGSVRSIMAAGQRGPTSSALLGGLDPRQVRETMTSMQRLASLRERTLRNTERDAERATRQSEQRAAAEERAVRREIAAISARMNAAARARSDRERINQAEERTAATRLRREGVEQANAGRGRIQQAQDERQAIVTLRERARLQQALEYTVARGEQNAIRRGAAEAAALREATRLEVAQTAAQRARTTLAQSNLLLTQQQARAHAQSLTYQNQQAVAAQRIVQAQNNAAASAVRLQQAQARAAQRGGAGAGGARTGGGASNFGQPQPAISVSSGIGALGALGALGGIGSVAGAIKLADEYRGLEARISLVTNGFVQQSAVMQELTRTAFDTRVGLKDTADVYYSLARNNQLLGLSQKEVIDVTSTINKSIAISGSSAQSASYALIQLGQAFGTGQLRGEELNSVLEQMPRLATLIAEGLGLKAPSALKSLAESGQLTVARVIEAIQKGQSKIAAEFAKMPLTVAQGFTVLKTGTEVLIGEFNKASGATEGLGRLLSNLGQRLSSPAFVDFAVDIGNRFGKLGSDILASLDPTFMWIKQNLNTVTSAFQVAAAVIGGVIAGKIVAGIYGIGVALATVTRATPLLAAASALAAVIGGVASYVGISKVASATIIDQAEAEKRLNDARKVSADTLKSMSAAQVQLTQINLREAVRSQEALANGHMKEAAEIEKTIKAKESLIALRSKEAQNIVAGDAAKLAQVQAQIADRQARLADKTLNAKNRNVLEGSLKALQQQEAGIKSQIESITAQVKILEAEKALLDERFSKELNLGFEARDQAVALNAEITRLKTTLTDLQGQSLNIKPVVATTLDPKVGESVKKLLAEINPAADATKKLEEATKNLNDAYRLDDGIRKQIQQAGGFQSVLAAVRAQLDSTLAAFNSFATTMNNTIINLKINMPDIGAGMAGLRDAKIQMDALDQLQKETAGQNLNLGVVADDPVLQKRFREIKGEYQKVLQLQDKTALNTQVIEGNATAIAQRAVASMKGFTAEQKSQAQGIADTMAKQGEGVANIQRRLTEEFGASIREQAAAAQAFSNATKTGGGGAEKKPKKDVYEKAEDGFVKRANALILENNMLGVIAGNTELISFQNQAINRILTERNMIATNENIALVTSSEQYARIREEVERTYAALQAAGRTGIGGGVQAGIQSYLQDIGDGFQDAQQLVTNAFKGMEDALVSFVTTGKLDFKGLVDSILADVARMAIRMLIMRPLMQLFGGMMGGPAGAGSGLFSSLSSAAVRFHKGGIAGTGKASGMTSLAAFAGARRYHSGGMAGMKGLKGSEVPVIAQRGEAILPTVRLPNGQMGVQAAGGGGGTFAPSISVVVQQNGGGGAGQNDPKEGQRMGEEIARMVDAQITQWYTKNSRPGGLVYGG
jgi:lambda family phage tail tape measure protein